MADKAKKPRVDAGRESEEEDEMEEGRLKGGRVKRQRGGLVGTGVKPSMRLDRPGRKRGGGVGANLSPLSTANRTQDAEGHSTGLSGCARQNPQDG